MRGAQRRTLPVGLTGGKACRSESWVGGSPPPRYRWPLRRVPRWRNRTRSRASSRRASSSSASRPTTSRSATPIRRARSSASRSISRNDVAKRLGVQVELVPVVAANRMEFLKQGRIDLMIATMAYKPDRAEVVGIPEPFYYAGAASVFAKKSSGLKNWTDLKGKPICAIQGAYYNRRDRRGVRRAARRVQGRDRSDVGARRRQLRRRRVRHDVLRRHHGRRQVGRLRDGPPGDRSRSRGAWACARTTPSSPPT